MRCISSNPRDRRWRDRVKTPDPESLLRAQAILGEVATLILPATGEFSLSFEDNLVDAIVGIITRHPMRESELIDSLTAWSSTAVQNTLDELSNSGRAQVVTRNGVRFWSALEAYYPKDSQG